MPFAAERRGGAIMPTQGYACEVEKECPLLNLRLSAAPPSNGASIAAWW